MKKRICWRRPSVFFFIPKRKPRSNKVRTKGFREPGKKGAPETNAGLVRILAIQTNPLIATYPYAQKSLIIFLPGPIATRSGPWVDLGFMRVFEGTGLGSFPTDGALTLVQLASSPQSQVKMGFLQVGNYLAFGAFPWASLRVQTDLLAISSEGVQETKHSIFFSPAAKTG